MNLFYKIFGHPNEKYLRKIRPLVEKINSLEPDFEKLSDEDLKKKTNFFKEKISQGENLDNVLPEAFALVREAAKRNLDQRHYDVQLMGGIAMHQRKIAEMKTGEGKTLASTLNAYLNALTGKGVHLVTVNDYLTKRDTVWMGQIYHALGLSVGCLVHDRAYLYDPDYEEDDKDRKRDLVGGFKIIESYLRPVERKEAYQADITYGTNNEFGFDYLRDNMVFDLEKKTQRKFNYAIIDEIDSILIDEARTPLIISAPDTESSQWYKDFSRIVPRLKKDIDYQIDEKLKVVSLTEEGIDKVEDILKLDNIYQEKGIRYLHHLEQALRAKVFFRRDRDYIVKGGEVIIVDEFTGRLMPGRRWSGGLHQAIEAKEGLKVNPESKTLASITFQNLFRKYSKLAGMTGTATTSSEEFEKVYDLEVVVIPTNEPMIRKDLPDLVYKNQKGKFKAIVREVKEKHKKGQPILIGTNSIDKNEILAKMLEREGISPEILNAKNHQREGEIIAQAGRKGQVTVATNMAGRGVDIILGGNPPNLKEAEEVKKLGGLYVIGVQRHEARRIDNQLRGRSGRQGNPGVSCFFVSLEDKILRVFGGERIQNLMNMLKLPEGQPIEAKMISGAIEKAQAKVEGFNFDARKHVLEYDNVISKQRNKIYSLRDEILESNYEELKEKIMEILKKELEKIVFSHHFDCEKISQEMKTIIPFQGDLSSKLLKLKEEKMIEFLNNLVKEVLEEKEKYEGKEGMKKIFKYAHLQTINILWSDHLSTMDSLRDSVRLRAYGGKDPLVEYRTEGHKMFQELLRILNSQVSRTIFKLASH